MPTSYVVTNEPQMFLDVSITSTQTIGIILSSPQVNGANHTFGSLSGGVLRIKNGSFYEDIYYATATIGSDNRVTLASGVVRNVDPSLTTTIVTAGAGRSWPKGSIVELTVDCRLLNNSAKKDVAGSFTANQSFPGGIDFVGTTANALRLVQVTTTQRNAMTPSEGWIVEDTTLKQVFAYLNGGWVALGTSTVTFPIGATQGGTGLSTIAKGATLYASATDTIAALAPNISSSAKKYMQSLGDGAAGLAPTFSAVDLAAGVTGTLPVPNGGTGATSLTLNNVILGNGTSAVQLVAPGTSGNVLSSNGTTFSSQPPSVKLRSVISAQETITANNTTSYTSASNYTIIANDLSAGTVYRIHASGTYGFVSGSGTNPGCTVSILLGAITIDSLTSVSNSTQTNNVFCFEETFTCLTNGAGGTYATGGMALYKNLSAQINLPNTATGSIDTTASQLIRLGLTVSNNAATFNLILNNLVITRLS